MPRHLLLACALVLLPAACGGGGGGGDWVTTDTPATDGGALTGPLYGRTFTLRGGAARVDSFGSMTLYFSNYGPPGSAGDFCTSYRTYGARPGEMIVVVEGESLRVGDLHAAPSAVSYLSVDPGCSTGANRTGARSRVSAAERVEAVVTSLTETTVSSVPLQKTIMGTLDIAFADRSSVSGTFELPVCHAEALTIDDPCR